MARYTHSVLAVTLMALTLGACGSGEKDTSLAALDAQLTNNAVDPAIKGALEDQIVVDPTLAGQSNRNAVRPADKPADGAVPVFSGDPAKAQAQALQLVGGKLMTAPAPQAADADGPSPLTLGALARDQGGRAAAGCAAKMRYAAQWASRMPDPFTVYPGGELMEAAGADTDGCTLRAISFTTPVPKQGVIDYYYTQARRAGFDGQLQSKGGELVLGGVRGSDDGAYVITFADAPGGKTAVDIVANNGG